MRQIQTNCGNCWFCCNAQCTYAGECTYSLKWSNTFNAFVPITYIENGELEW